MWATLISAWVVALMGLMEQEHNGRAFITFIGPVVLKMPMGFLMTGMVLFYWIQVWLILTNLPLSMSITVVVIGSVMAMFSWYVFAHSIQGVYAAQQATAPQPLGDSMSGEGATEVAVQSERTPGAAVSPLAPREEIESKGQCC